ncbi:MAG: CBS domain-containing protein [Planctomycetes bacterium]|jgi:acetoin utilization protein AcuB|nr:CBS domain-containing protein [Planctomycetota bacterium]
MRVKDFMNAKPWTISKDRNLRETRETMLAHKVRRLPVLDGDVLVGIITKEDILAAGPSMVDYVSREEFRDRMEGTYVESIMTEDPYTVNEDDPVEKAAQIMFEKKIGGLPVLRGPKLVGIITETDIFKAFVQLIGISTESERLDVDCADPVRALAEVGKQIEERRLCPSSLLVYQREDGARRMIVHARKEAGGREKTPEKKERKETRKK